MRPGTRVKRTQHGLAHLGQPFGEPQGRRELAAGNLAIGFRIRALDVEQDQIKARQEFVMCAMAEETGCLNCRVEA